MITDAFLEELSLIHEQVASSNNTTNARERVDSELYLQPFPHLIMIGNPYFYH